MSKEIPKPAPKSDSAPPPPAAMSALPLWGFILRFALIFGLLAAPWPGWEATYANAVRRSCTKLFGSLGSKGLARFRPNPERMGMLDTVIYLGNRDQLDARESGPAARYRFSTRINAYLPTAMVVALVLATSLPWRSRLRALGWGLLWVHLFLCLVVGAMLLSTYCNHPELEFGPVSPFWRSISSGFDKVLENAYLGFSLSLAVVIWILVCFRGNDWQTLLQMATPASVRAAGAAVDTASPSAR